MHLRPLLTWTMTGCLAAMGIACGSDDTSSSHSSGGSAGGGGSAGASGGTAGGSGGGGGSASAPRPLVDPGSAPWEPVAPGDVAEVCGLDPDLLAATDTALQEIGGKSYAIVRYGRWCHEYDVNGADAPSNAFSATKTLGAVVTGIASYETRDLPRTGRKTGQLSDMDRVDHWLDTLAFSPEAQINPEARISHVLGMVGHNADLTEGARQFTYDALGTTQINSLSTVVNAAIAQDPARLGANIDELTERFLFQPLGMTGSTWTDGAPEKNYAFTWVTTLGDMARLGLLLLNGGVWSGQRVLDADWVYRMTHPSFEDANTAYGYLTWMSARTNWVNIAPPKLTEPTDDCLPAALWNEYPHESSGTSDCSYGGAPCVQEYDVGVWFAAGLFGQYIFGHPGLDMVMVVKDLHPNDVDPRATTRAFWAAFRKAVIALDPEYAGDEAAFCDAYGQNRYAPDLRP